MLLAHLSVAQLSDASLLKSGDIVFQTSQSSQSRAIQIATHSIHSHVGIFVVIDKKEYVYEAVQPVKLTPFTQWKYKGDGNVFFAKRLISKPKGLNKEERVKLRELFLQHRGKDYDLYFNWNSDKMYCSELVWKIYKELLGIEVGKFETLRDLDLTNAHVKDKLAERYGPNIPYDEKMITPNAIFESELLHIITP